jgi:hypothetical protein
MPNQEGTEGKPPRKTLFLSYVTSPEAVRKRLNPKDLFLVEILLGFCSGYKVFGSMRSRRSNTSRQLSITWNVYILMA